MATAERLEKEIGSRMGRERRGQDVSEEKETRIYEVEREIQPNTWEFVSNLTVEGYAIVNQFLAKAEELNWPVGDYRVLHWDEHYASGSFFLITLRSGPRVAELAKPVSEDVAA